MCQQEYIFTELHDFLQNMKSCNENSDHYCSSSNHDGATSSCSLPSQFLLHPIHTLALATSARAPLRLVGATPGPHRRVGAQCWGDYASRRRHPLRHRDLYALAERSQLGSWAGLVWPGRPRSRPPRRPGRRAV